MLTPLLERLILCGKAQTKTYIASSQKNVIDVPKDHFIIIHHFSHFPFLPVDQLEPDPNLILLQLVTQMKVFSDKSYSNYVIRNNINRGIGFNGTTGEIIPVWNTGTPYQENVYLVHETDVSISFSKTLRAPAAASSAIAPAQTVAKPTPADYGRNGFAGSIAVATEKVTGVNAAFRPLGKVTPPSAVATYNLENLEFPINATTALTDADIQKGVLTYPLCIFQYLEINGRPTDIMQSN